MGLRNAIPDDVALWIADPAQRRNDAREAARRDDFDSFCKIIGYVPHSAQREVHANRHVLRRVLDWGVRTGKTKCGAVEGCFEVLKDNRRVWIIAPQHALTERVWSEIEQCLLEDLGFNPATRSTVPRRLQFGWGSVIEGHSTHDPASRNAMTGASVNFAVWDECARSPGSVWELKLQPRLGDVRGRCMFISTPEGYNHFYEWFERGKPNADGKIKDEAWRSFNAWCEVNFCNKPDLEESVAEARRTFSQEAFRQEWLGEFTTFAGRVYPEFDEGLHSRSLQYNPDLPLALAFDFGVDNPFVCLWLQFGAGDTCYVIDEYTTAVIRDGREEVRQSLTTQENGEEVLRQHAEWGYGPWEWAVGDKSGADEIRTLSRHCGIRAIHRHVTPGNVREREVPAGIRRVRRFLREGRLIVDSERCPITTFELNRYRYPDRPEDRNASEVPEKANDHAMDALRYGIIYYLARHPEADKRWEGDEDEPMAPTPSTLPEAPPAFPPASERLMARIGRRNRR